MFESATLVIFMLMIIINHPVVSFKTSECAKKCTANVWKNTLHSEKVKLYNTVMPIFILVTPRDLQWYLKPDDEEIDQYNMKRYSSVTDDQLNRSHDNLFVVWPIVEELFDPTSNGSSKNSKKIQLFDLINTISANLTVANLPILLQSIALGLDQQSIVLHNDSLLESITLLKEFLQIDRINRIPDCVYKIYYNEAMSRRYVENFIINLLDRLETNANRIYKTIQSFTDHSYLDILNCWSEMRRDILVLYDLFDSFEQALQILKISDDNHSNSKSINNH